MVFFWYFLVFLVFLGWYSNPKFQYQKKPKNPKKNQKKPTEPKKPVSNFECWPRPMPKKNQKKPKKTKKNQFPISNFGQNQCQKKPKKNQKKTKKNQCQFGNLKKPKKNQKKNQCQFTDFGVATGFFFVFFWVSTPPKRLLSGSKAVLKRL